MSGEPPTTRQAHDTAAVTAPSSASAPMRGSDGTSTASAPSPSAHGLVDEQQEQDTRSKEEIVDDALNCPCIAGMKNGSCGDQFMTAYRCFLESETDPKGSDCLEQFRAMQTCMVEHPAEYSLDEDDNGGGKEGEAEADEAAEKEREGAVATGGPSAAAVAAEEETEAGGDARGSAPSSGGDGRRASAERPAPMPAPEHERTVGGGGTAVAVAASATPSEGERDAAPTTARGAQRDDEEAARAGEES